MSHKNALSRFCLLVLACLAGLVTVACSPVDQARRAPDPRLVMAHSQGLISRFDRLSVILTARRSFSTDPARLNPFRLQPAVAGRAVWSDDGSRVDFIPDQPLAAGQAYGVVFDFAQLGQGEAGWFSFDVQAALPSIRVADLRLAAQSDGRLALSGRLLAQDIPSSADVEGLLSARLLGAEQNISWSHPGGQTHDFLIRDLARAEADTSLELGWDGRPAGALERGVERITLPAAGSFQVLSVQPPSAADSAAGNGALTVAFSQPLDPAQDLRGFIHSPQVGNLRCEVDGGLVRDGASASWPESLQLTIESGLRSQQAQSLAVPVQATVNVAWEIPQARFSGGGTIVPSSQGTRVVLETMNLTKVYVEAVHVYGDNVLQFLQVNTLSGAQELYRVGDVVWSEEIELGWQDANKNRWLPYGLDLSPLLARHPDGLYQLRVSFGHDGIRYISPASVNIGRWEFPPVYYVDENSSYNRFPNGYPDWFDWDEYYHYRNEPNHPAFYYNYYGEDRGARRNVLVSDVGIMAKLDLDGVWHVAASDLRSARPLPAGSLVTAYSYSMQEVARASVDTAGTALLQPAAGQEAAYLVVDAPSMEHGRGYLKLDQPLVTSHFDVSGERTASGIKGFLYGERGVWRPGDDIHLVFMLFDPRQALPTNYPILFELVNPLGQVVQSLTQASSVNGVYYIKTGTAASAPTGSWTARVKAGDLTFSKVLKVETIMPNRLRLALDFGHPSRVSFDTRRMSVQAAWLHGAPAPGLRADVSLLLSGGSQALAAWPDYTFLDPLRSVSGSRSVLFEGNLDQTGRASFDVDLSEANGQARAPGPLQATFLTRVFENSGLFSTEAFTVDYHPYERYVGLKLPQGPGGGFWLRGEDDNKVDIIVVDRDGRRISGDTQLTVSLYQVRWHWWWSGDEDNLASESSDIIRNRISSTTVAVRNGTAVWDLELPQDNHWGYYLVHVADQSGGHAAGKTFYLYWWGRDNQAGGDTALMLNLSTDRKTYDVGQPVQVSFPSNGQGRAFVTIERNGRVLREEWIQTADENTTYRFTASADMAPNVYVHVSFIQPHLQTANDLPIRLYGIVPVKVENPATRLQPQVTAPDSLTPGASARFTVSEAAGRAMTYTVAVVDEGLLGITRYQAPNPWDSFYRKEASLLLSHDLYRDVANAFSGNLQTILAIGGSEFDDSGGDKPVSRFPPVVRFYGPFSLAAGQRQEHELVLGNYIGSVRFMVVAGTPQGAFGRQELAVPVRADLMAFITAPRVLGPDELLTVPVSVFSFLGNGAAVDVSLRVEGEASLVSAANQQLTFGVDGEQLANFEIRGASQTGRIRLVATATATNGARSEQAIELPLRSPAIPVTTVNSALLPGNRAQALSLTLPGIGGSNDTWLELSILPPIDLSSRLAYLIGYPHGCGEQTTSRAFPQLFLQDATVLSAEQIEDVRYYVQEAIDKLTRMQTVRGGFVYWMGDSHESDWLSVYVTHFLLAAKRQGYPVAATVLDSALKYLDKQALEWNARNDWERSTQAYRLYVLAAGGKPNIAAMNRFMEYGPHHATAVYQLAAAYALAGNRPRASSLIQNVPPEPRAYEYMYYTYGSLLRDKAMILEVLNVLGDTTRGLSLYTSIAAALSSNHWYSTQELSYCLVACLPYLRLANSGRSEVSWSVGNGSAARVAVNRGIQRLPVAASSGPLSVNLTNHTTTPVYARLVATGTPLPGREQPKSDGLRLSVRYLDTSGMEVNPDAIRLGDDLIIMVSVQNSGAEDLANVALTFRSPSGWELANPRLGNANPDDEEGEDPLEESPYDYRDLRDDRVLTYFPLERNEWRTYRFFANKTYNGEFFLPAIVAEAMYQPEIQAVVPGRRLSRPQAQPDSGTSNVGGVVTSPRKTGEE